MSETEAQTTKKRTKRMIILSRVRYLQQQLYLQKS